MEKTFKDNFLNNLALLDKPPVGFRFRENKNNPTINLSFTVGLSIL